MVFEDNRQKSIVRQSCLNRATEIITAQMGYDKTVQEADADTLKTIIFSYAQDFESWVNREGESKKGVDTSKRRVEQLSPKKKLRSL